MQDTGIRASSDAEFLDTLTRAKQGDQTAWARLEAECWPFFRRWLYIPPKYRAKFGRRDIAQQVWLSLYPRLPSLEFTMRAEFLAYLKRAALSRLMDACAAFDVAKRTVHCERPADAAVSYSDICANEDIADFELTDFWEYSLRWMTPSQRFVVRCMFHGFSCDETGTVVLTLCHKLDIPLDEPSLHLFVCHTRQLARNELRVDLAPSHGQTHAPRRVRAAAPSLS